MSAVRVLVNPRAAARAQPYPVALALDAEGFAVAAREISAWPGYAPTPLLELPALATALGLAELRYKDERGRFGLKSFKALGGAYAVRRVLSRQPRPVQDVTVTCATDGNHGRSVAWGAQLFGCRCVIFIHETVSEGRAAAIRRYGAEVRRVKGNYDDAVRHAADAAAKNGWHVVSDTSYEGYRDVPRDVMHGYGVMAGEILAQWPADRVPTHVFVQAGVGALAAALCASFWLHWRERRPRCVVVEPSRADCFYRSIEAGRPVAVHGDLDTVMAGLACGEVSALAWEVLATGADAVVAIDDAYALEAVRVLAAPRAGDPVVVAGETGGAGLAALLALQARPELRAQLALGGDSAVLLLGSEGDTDPEIYRRIVGRSADEVLAA
ncbi:MAG: diaminopropionate ammonia-lyase [Betaproteobacteria bacterium]|nr:MAG: diaminopropionate ammonia-lyase [Betaproteobacteria bacterium]